MYAILCHNREKFRHPAAFFRTDGHRRAHSGFRPIRVLIAAGMEHAKRRIGFADSRIASAYANGIADAT